MRSLLMTPVLSLVLGLPHLAWADSLWLGTDNTTNRPVLNTTRTGVEIGHVDDTEATGIAIDLGANLIYFGIAEAGGQYTKRSLSTPGTVIGSPITPNPPLDFGEDMAFDGTSIWRVDITGTAVDQINPATGDVTSSFNPGFLPLGVAWDGSNLWVSQFALDGLVKQFTPAGAATGNQFNAHLGGSSPVGGLAWDTADSTLWVGTWNKVYHYQTDGTQLSSFDVTPTEARFIDGLEFQGTATSAVPEPGSLLLFATGLVLLGGVVRKQARNR